MYGSKRLSSGSTSVKNTVSVSNVSDRNTECTGREQGNMKIGHADLVPSSSPSPAHARTNEEIVITSIRATNLALDLKRIPSGFYTVVQHSGREWRTENRRSSVNNNVVEWDGPIPLPSDLSAVIRLEIYASFDFQPMLGNGEQLRMLAITVEQLLDYSAKDLPFKFLSKSGDVVSLSVTVRRRKREHGDRSPMRVLDPYRSITECRSQLKSATDEVHRALLRYQKHGGKRDLERSIEQFECALNSCPLDHPCRAAAKSNMTLAKVILYRVNDTVVSFDVPLALYHGALSARPVGHPDRPSISIHLAILHFARFETRQDEVDAAQAGALLHQAMELSSADSQEKWAAISVLRLHTRCKKDPVQAGARLPAEWDSAPPFTYGAQWNFAFELVKRYERFGKLDDLQQAITLSEGLVKSTSFWDPRYPEVLLNLGTVLMYRFQRLGKLRDLELAISRFWDAVNLTPDGHPTKPDLMKNLGSSFIIRFEHLGTISDLERAISTLGNVLDLTPDDHSDKAGRLNNLGGSFFTRFERLGKLSDLERAISMLKDAVYRTPDDHPDKPARLNNLGASLTARFERLEDLSDLEDAISVQVDAVHLIPDGHIDKPSLLSNLSNSFLTRFIRIGEISDLERAISMQRDAVNQTPDGHPDKPDRLQKLGTSFMTRFERLGELNDLGRAISTLGDAAHLTPVGHPDKPARLSSLGTSFGTRFQRLGELRDLERAISSFRDAVHLIPDGHPDKPALLMNLGTSFFARFQRLGDLGDLERAISIQENAVHLIPLDSHSYKLSSLNNLCAAFLTRFQHLGELSDLERAISTQGDVVHLTPNDHPDKPTLLRLGELRDLGRAILALGDAVLLSPDDHPHKPAILNNLGTSLLTRFKRLGDLSDLERAISVQGDAVYLTPDGHPDKPGRLHNLGNAFLTRFERLGELSDLRRAVWRYWDAAQLTPDGHSHKPAMLNSLGNAFFSRFQSLGDIGDIEQAILVQGSATDLVPAGHPRRPDYIKNLGTSFFCRFERLGLLSDLERAISLFAHSASHSSGPAITRFYASVQWISCARTAGHCSLLHAYSIAVGLLPQLAWSGLSLAHRYRELIGTVDVVREAAAAALDSGHPEMAVEWLEQGRSYDELLSVHPDYASKLRELSTKLKQAGATREKSISLFLDATRDARQDMVESLEQEAQRHRTLAIERDKLLQEIRGLPGFERFLLHTKFSQLHASARSGPIVILNVAKSRCDALIVLADVENVIHVPLPNFSLERSEAIQTSMKSLVRHAKAIPLGERVGHRMPQELDGQWELILSSLWKCVVNPVLHSLALEIPGQQPRIFWCPTGPLSFFPIHAAGFYDTAYSQPGHKVFDFVVSSYVPTLSALTPSLEPHAASSSNLRFLAVRQPPSDGLSHLPGVDAELKHIRAIIRNSHSARTTLKESSSGTVEEVLELMKEADWVHFACHGIQDAANPTESGLCLANERRLTLSKIIALSRPPGGLTFLSACQTAKGDKNLSDEAIHIAAGMLFAGYGGVVGTMWSISDWLAPTVAKDVYEQLFSKGTRPEYQEAARALQDAVGRLRDGGASFSEWLPFIHVGH